MPTGMTLRALVLRMLLSLILITAVLFLMFMLDRDTAGYINFMKFFIPLSVVLFGTFIITYAILERRTNFHHSIRVLIAGIISYIATLGTIGFFHGLDLWDVVLGVLWVVVLGVVAIYETVLNVLTKK